MLYIFWKHSKRPKKLDYTKAKAYQSIALEIATGTIIESIMADIMRYLTETHQLLPMGSVRKKHRDAMMILSESIYNSLEIETGGYSHLLGCHWSYQQCAPQKTGT